MKWISVEDELPEHHQSVMMQDRSLNLACMRGRYECKDGPAAFYPACCRCYLRVYVSHWTPLKFPQTVYDEGEGLMEWIKLEEHQLFTSVETRDVEIFRGCICEIEDTDDWLPTAPNSKLQYHLLFPSTKKLATHYLPIPNPPESEEHDE